MTTKRRYRRLLELNEEELIRQVEMRPMLYDRSLKSYRKSGLRMLYWREVSNKMGAPLEECRTRWRSLRDTFGKQFRLANKRSAPPFRKKWVFYDQMSFMAPYLDKANCDIDQQLLTDLADNSDDGEALMLAASHDAMATLETPSSAKDLDNNGTVDEPKFADELTQVDENNFLLLPEDAALEDHAVAKVSEAGVVGGECHQHDSNEKFLLSCAPMLRRLSHRKNALARLKIQQILFDIEFGTLDN